MDFFEMHLTHSAFKAMQEGNKNIEIRLYDEKRRELKKDDIISFLDIITENVINTRVISINIFSSFKILYERYPKKSLGYAESETADYSDMFEYYSENDEKKYGVVAIEIEVMK